MFLEKIRQNPKFWLHFSQYFPKNDSFDSLVVGGYDDVRDGKDSYKHTQALLRLMRCIMDWSDIVMGEVNKNEVINMINAKSRSISPNQFEPPNFNIIANDSLKGKISGVIETNAEMIGKINYNLLENRNDAIKNIDFSDKISPTNKNHQKVIDDLNLKRPSVSRTEDMRAKYGFDHRNSPDRMEALRERNNRSIGVSEDLANRNNSLTRSVHIKPQEYNKTNYKRREKIQEVMTNIESLEKRLRYTYDSSAAKHKQLPKVVRDLNIINPKYHEKPKSETKIKISDSMPNITYDIMTSDPRFENRKLSPEGSVLYSS